MYYDPLDKSPDTLTAILIDDDASHRQAKPLPTSMFADVRFLEVVAQIFSKLYPATSQRCGARIPKAISIARFAGNIYAGRVPGTYNVKGTDPNVWYEVDTCTHTCTCLDHFRRGPANPCKHRLAVGFLINGADWITAAATAQVAVDYNPMPWALRTAKQDMENAQYYENELLKEADKYDDQTDPDYIDIRHQITVAAHKARKAEHNYDKLYSEYYSQKE